MPKPEDLAQLVFVVRGERIMLDADLAKLYGVSTRALNQAVKRNRDRFPSDFMFRLSKNEATDLRSQNVILNPSLGGGEGLGRRPMAPGSSRSQTVTLKRGQNIKYLPYAFTEQGVAMLSSVLRSSRAVEVNISVRWARTLRREAVRSPNRSREAGGAILVKIAIMRTFVQLRRLMDSNRDLARKIEALEGKYDEQFAVVFEAIKRLIAPPGPPRRRIGFGQS